MIRAAATLPSLRNCLRATGLSSTLQAKFALHLFKRNRRPTRFRIAQRLFEQSEVFPFLDPLAQRLAREIALRAAHALGHGVETGYENGIETNGKHDINSGC